MKGRLFLVGLALVFVGVAFGQMRGKVIIASEDTTIIRNIGVGKAMAKSKEEHLGSPEIRREIHRYIDEALDEARDEVPRGFQRGFHRVADDDFYGWHQTAKFFMMAVVFGWMAIVFVMWIISLVVIGRGFNKIARSIEREKKAE